MTTRKFRLNHSFEPNVRLPAERSSMEVAAKIHFSRIRIDLKRGSNGQQRRDTHRDKPRGSAAGTRTNLRHLSPLGIPPGVPRSARPIPPSRTLSHHLRPRRRHRRRGPPLLLRKLRHRVHAHSKPRAASVAPGPNRAPRTQARPATRPNATHPCRPLRAGDPATLPRHQAVLARRPYRPHSISRSGLRNNVSSRRHPLHHRHGASRPPQRHDQHDRPLALRDLRQIRRRRSPHRPRRR